MASGVYHDVFVALWIAELRKTDHFRHPSLSKTNHPWRPHGQHTSAKAGTIPWTRHEPLPATALGPDNVGFHAREKSVQDPAPLPVHAQERTTVSVTDFGADPTGGADSAAAVHRAVIHAKSLGTP